MKQTWKNLLLCGALLISVAPDAYAYRAHVVEHKNRIAVAVSVPKEGAIYHAPPALLTITFTKAINPKNSHIIVYNKSFATQVTDGSLPQARDERTVSIALPRLSHGKYMVKWDVECACTSRERSTGKINFSVK